MTLLHVHFNLRNQLAFQRLLDGTATRGQPSPSNLAILSTSGGKSWNRSSALSSLMAVDVNARDWLGRTVLHLACASVEPSSIQYIRLLLAHPAINVNLQDTESNWTALHRALYAGNIASAILLLKRSDIDMSLKDLEGYTAFDLYNTTLKTTKPDPVDGGRGDLFTWGVNRNAALGVGDGNDRTYPEHVTIQKKHSPALHDTSLENRFSPIQVQQVSMSRLHTVIVTSESQDNMRLCGFGSGGRLGLSQNTQYNLMALPEFSSTVISVALGQDHTLALTKDHEILSWGLNRFSQLGYVIDPTPAVMGRREEPIQVFPRKIVHLKKEIVKGVAACKTASACWTDTEVFTWGTNNGQLGYNRNTAPVQVLPRKVAGIVYPVTAIAMTDNAMACLYKTGDVAFLWNDLMFKINFPTQSFPSAIHVYRPPQAVKGPKVTKITSCEDTFSALSSNGEVFIFTPPTSSPDGSHGKGSTMVTPQRVWALRKQFSGVRDVELGTDGSIIVCTLSGHVFVRIRNPKSGQTNSAKAFKFQRVPYIQRAIKVCANSTGAFGALRVDFRPDPIRLSGPSFAEDMASIQPYLVWRTDNVDLADSAATASIGLSRDEIVSAIECDDDSEDVPILEDIAEFSRFIDLIRRERATRNTPGGRLYDYTSLPHGADLLVSTSSGGEFPAHQIILAARCTILRGVFFGTNTIEDRASKITITGTAIMKASMKSTALPRLVFTGCSVLSILMLLRYLYRDEPLAVWDRRIGMPFEAQLNELKLYPGQIRSELQTLAKILKLPHLAQALQSPSKRVPTLSMTGDFQRLFHTDHSSSIEDESFITRNLPPDVVLQLADKDVLCYSVVLRARSPFFASFFGDEDWTMKRRDKFGVVKVNMKHLTWRVMEYILRFLCCGEEETMFHTISFVETGDQVVEFMFEVMAAASEYLLDRMILHCSAVILKYLNINNVCFMLSDATHFHAVDLVESLQGYMAANLETLLECGMLDDISPNLITQLSKFTRKQQLNKSPVARSSRLVDEAMKKHHGWLAEQDIPEPILCPRGNKTPIYRASPKLSPSVPTRKSQPPVPSSPSSSPPIQGTATSIGDEIFSMDAIDDGEVIPSLELGQTPVLPEPTTPQSKSAVWKRSLSTRVDLKVIMAETEHNNATTQPPMLTYMWPEQATQRPNATAIGPSPSRTGTSPWKIPVAPITPIKVPLAPSPASPNKMRTKASGSQPTTIQPVAYSPSRNTASPKVQQTQSALGPVITPTRASTAKGSPSGRRVSTAINAWTLPSVKPIVEPTPSNLTLTFAEIQRLQSAQGDAGTKEKRSLLDIQEEEQSRQREEEFLRWWADEEERVRLLESQLVGEAGEARNGTKKRKGRGNRTQGSSEATPNQGKSTGEKKPPKDTRGSKGTKS